MSGNTRGSSRNQRNNPYQLDDLFVQFHRTPAGIAWRFRTELIITAILAVTLWRLSILMTISWAGVVLALIVVVVLAAPHSRRFITRRYWCVLTRHRLHRLCYEARLHTRSGRLPLIMWIRPTKVGERAWILCRAGICAEDFEAHTGELRAACYARDARVTRNRKHSHLVTIDIIRRDTLAASNTITSPLARLTAHYQHHPALALIPPESTGDEHEPAAPPAATARMWLCEHCWWAWPLTVPFCGTCGRSRAATGADREFHVSNQPATRGPALDGDPDEGQPAA
jgi:hypothetical protein